MTFEEYLKNAWSIHPTESQKLLDEFRQHFSLLKTSDDVLAMAELITHVTGEHLGKWSEGLHYLNTLKHNPLLKDFSEIDRLMASLSLALDSRFSIDSYSDSDQVIILGMTASALASQNDTIRASEYLERAHDIAKRKLSKMDPAIRSLAEEANNIAFILEEKETCTKVEMNLMIQAAFIGRKYWEAVGTWKEIERAEYRLAQTFLKAQVLDKAYDHAEKCLAIIAENNNEPLEVFFGFKSLALIEKARKNKLGFDEAIGKMKEAFNKITSEDQIWCKEILENVAGQSFDEYSATI